MEKKLNFIFYHLIFQILFIINKKNFTRSICQKEKPILKDNICQAIYCSEEEFNNNDCKIDNDIIKTQWLNNFIVFNEYNYRFINIVINKDGDLILETSPEELGGKSGKRLFFRLKKNGNFFFKNENNEEVMSRSIVVLNDDGEGALRYESQVFLVKINDDSDGSIKEFLVSISIYFGYMEIYDIDDNNIRSSKILISQYSNFTIYSRKSSIIKLNDKEYLFFFIGQISEGNTYYLVIEKYSFKNSNIINQVNIGDNFENENKKAFIIKLSRNMNAFKTVSNQIIVFYYNTTQYTIDIYDENMNYIIQMKLERPTFSSNEDFLFFKSIHLKENIGIFSYYIHFENVYPKILIYNMENNQFINMFEMNFEYIISSYEFNNEPLLNDLIKINDNRFSLISASHDKTQLYITLFDLYNNDLNIKIRFYKIDLFNLYKYVIFNDLTSIIYNNLLTVSMSTCNTAQCNYDDKNFFTSLLIFGFVNGSNNNIDNSTYVANPENNNSDDIYINFPNSTRIDNNIFGYQILQFIKIISIPYEINLYYINNGDKKQVNIGDNNIPSDKLVISTKTDIIKNNSVYYIEYQIQYSDPDYDTFNQYPDIIIDYPENPTVDQKEEFNDNVRVYYGKTLKMEFTLCNDNCKTCKLIGKSDEQTKCEECKDNLKSYYNKDTNSYTCFPVDKECPENFPFLSGDNSLKCIKECPEDYPFLSKSNHLICQKECDYDDLINDECTLINLSTTSLKQAYKMFNDFISNGYNNEEIVLPIGDDLIMQLSNSENEKSNLNSGTRKYYNLSVIDLGECETKLKNANGISLDLSLIILKVESYYENTTIKNVQYEIFNPVTKKKITDLSPCSSAPIDIYVPTNLNNNSLTIYEEMINQGYDIFNPNDSFYNDICTKYTSANNTDLTLNDRKDLFYNGSQIFCQENCVYKNVNIKTSQAKCECSITESKEIDYETKQFHGFEIITSFYDVIKYSNFLILKCYKLVFSIYGFKNNIGSIIILIYIFFHVIFAIIFLFTGMNKIRDHISKMVFCSINKVNIVSISISQQKCRNINDIHKAIFPQAPNKKKKIKNKRKIQGSPKRKFKNMKPNDNKSKSNDLNGESVRNYTSCWGLNPKKRNSILSIASRIKDAKVKNRLNKNFNRKTKKKKRNNSMKYSEFELDDLEYLEAIKYDKRTFFEFFLCLVKREHIIVVTFIFCSDLNLLTVKLSLFVFSISLDFATNVLFFTDDSMHKIYLDYGKYNFVTQIPQMIYSTTISEIFDVFLKYLSLSEGEIYEIKNIKKLNNAIEKVKKIIRKLKIKFFCFFIITFILISFFWYFIAAFCAVYENTQIILIKDSAGSFVISLLYPFILYLIPASLRIMALRSKKKDKRFIYKLSNIFPLF